MALTERLALLVSLDANGAIKGLEQVGKAADRNLGKAESKLDKTAAQFKKAGTVMLAGAGLMATGLYKAGQSAADLEQSVGGTEAVFKDAAGYIEKYAKGAARNMGLSETAFRTATTSIGGQLKGVGFDIDTAAEKSVELTGVAADLAATYGGTTAEAVAALGAAFRGEADPAERFNLRLNQNTVNAKAVEMGLAATTSQVDAHAKAQATLALIMEQSADAQGQFARETDTAAGSMAIASAEFENAKASLGQSVAPIIASVAGGFADIAGGFRSADEASDGLISKLATFGTLGLGAAGGVSFVVGKFIEMRDIIGKLPAGLQSVASTAGKAATSVGLLYTAVQLLGDSASRGDLSKLENDLLKISRGGKVAGEAADVLGGDFEKLSGAIERIAAPSVASQAENAIDSLGRAFGDTDDDLSQARATIDDLDEALSSLAAKDPQAAAAALSAITDSLSPEDADRLLGLLDGYKSGLAEIDTQAQTAGAGVGGLTGALDANAPATETAAEKVERLKNELEEATEAISDNYSAMFEATGLAIGYEAAIDDLIAGLKENGTTLDLSTEKGRANMEQIIDTGESIADLIEKRYEETGSIDDARDAGILYVENLKNQLRAAGYTEDAIAQLIAQMHLTPEEIRTDILADTANASRAVSDYQRLINNTPRLITTTFNGVMVNRPNRMEGNANGTSFFGGGYTWVGERGPEIVELPRGSKVHDATDSARMSSGGAGTIVIPVSIGGQVIETIVVDAQARSARRGVAA